MTLIRVVCGFPNAEKVRCPHGCFAAHTLQNKELLFLKSFNAFKRYILLPSW